MRPLALLSAVAVSLLRTSAAAGRHQGMMGDRPEIGASEWRASSAVWSMRFPDGMDCAP